MGEDVRDALADVLDAVAARQENLRDGLVLEFVFLAVGLQAGLYVERPRTVVAANQLTTVLTMIAVVPILNLLLCSLRSMP